MLSRRIMPYAHQDACNAGTRDAGWAVVSIAKQGRGVRTSP